MLLTTLNTVIELEKFYTVREFAGILRVHPNTVRKMIKDGRLHPINTGSDVKPTYRIPDADLLRLSSEYFKEQD